MTKIKLYGGTIVEGEIIAQGFRFGAQWVKIRKEDGEIAFGFLTEPKLPQGRPVDFSEFLK